MMTEIFTSRKWIAFWFWFNLGSFIVALIDVDRDILLGNKTDFVVDGIFLVFAILVTNAMGKALVEVTKQEQEKP